MPLAGDQCQRHNTGDVHLRAKNMHVQAELLTDGLNVFQTLLVVRAGTTDPDLDLVLDEEGSDFAESTDHALEGGCDL